MSKYERLQDPLCCLWCTNQEGYTCGKSFTNVRLLTDHVRKEHIPPRLKGNGANANGGVRCGWNGCTQVILGSQSDYVAHVLYHPYHCFLKLLGSELQTKLQLPACQYQSQFSNVVQTVEVELRCLWDKGQCQMLFDNVWEFYCHVQGHIKALVELKCCWGTCTFTGRDRNKIRDHVRSHLQEKQVACPTCGLRFSNNTKLKDHLNRQLDPSRDPELSCDFCHKSFPTARLLREHTRKHINSVKCPDCDLTCQGPSRLIQHIRYRHVDRKSHQCPLCNKSYKTVQSLSFHIETHGEFKQNCQWPNCSYFAKSERLLKAHEQTMHKVTTGEGAKLFCCHVCDSRFLFGRQLTVHLKKDHGFELPPGHCRFRYVVGKDGFKRLQTVRLDDENLYTPEVNTFTSPTTLPRSSLLMRPHLSGSDVRDKQQDTPSGDITGTRPFGTSMSATSMLPGNVVPISAILGSNKSTPESHSSFGASTAVTTTASDASFLSMLCSSSDSPLNPETALTGNDTGFV